MVIICIKINSFDANYKLSCLLTGANPHVTRQAVQSSKATVITCFSFVFNGPGFRLNYSLFILLMSKQGSLSLPSFPKLSPKPPPSSPPLPRCEAGSPLIESLKIMQSQPKKKIAKLYFPACMKQGRVAVMNVDPLYSLHFLSGMCSLLSSLKFFSHEAVSLCWFARLAQACLTDQLPSLPR